MIPNDLAAKIVLQHAESSRLFGVDFVPVYGALMAAERTQPDERRAVRPDHGRDAPDLEPDKPTALWPGQRGEVEAKGRANKGAPPPAPAPEPARREPARPSGPVRGKDRQTAQAELDALRERYEREAPHKKFISSFNKIVFGEGDPRARIMFVGEAPGAEEDRTGRPFVGPAGKLLDKMITAMGLSRDDVYIGNVLKVRPPNNATPTSAEVEASAPYLYEQIRIIGPEVIVALGLPAARTLLATDESMGRLRGRFSEFKGIPGMTIPVMPTYHPAFLLRQYTPENRRKVWSDLQMVMERIGHKSAGG